MYKRIIFLFFLILSGIQYSSAQSVYLIKCKTLYQLDKYDELMEPALQAVKAEPKSAQANFYLALAYMFVSDSTNALFFINEAAAYANAEEEISVLDVRASLYYELHKYREALGDLFFLLDHNQTPSGVYWYMGRCYEGLEILDSAGIYYRKAISIYPDSEDILIEYARYKANADDLDSSMIIFKRCLQINPQSPQAMMGMAKIATYKSDFAETMLRTDAVLDIIKQGYYDSATVQAAFIDVYHHRMCAAIFFERYDAVDADLKNFSLKDVYSVCMKNLMGITSFIAQGKITEANKEMKKITDSVTVNSYEFRQTRMVLSMHSKDVKTFSATLISMCENDPEGKTLKERIIAPFAGEQTVIAGDILFYRENMKGEIHFDLNIQTDKAFLQETKIYLDKFNKSNKASNASIRALLMVEELLNAI